MQLVDGRSGEPERERIERFGDRNVPARRRSAFGEHVAPEVWELAPHVVADAFVPTTSDRQVVAGTCVFGPRVLLIKLS